MSKTEKKKIVRTQEPEATMMLNKDLDKDWSTIPDYITSGLLSGLVFIMGITMRGDWLMFMAHYRRSQDSELDSLMDRNATEPTELGLWLQERFTGLWPDYIVGATVVSYLFFFGIGGFLHVYYYVMQKDNPESWKCQPNKWLSKKDEIHEIIVGWFSLTIGSVLSAALATWVINGGYTTIYYEFGKHGYLWALVELPFVFLLTDYITYWYHRIYHLPFLYKKLWFQPWQPDCIFHDNHHQYFHVNFGFNVELWDKLHGTQRQKDKIYREDIFYGNGKDISEATREELEADEQQRHDENPLAYQQNKNKYL